MKKILLTYISLLVCTLSWAQTIPYACSFEEGEDLSNWTMNYQTSAAMDQWIVGSMVHSEGRRSMYISSDGSNPIYGHKPNIVASYMTFKFPESTKIAKYDITFDWKCVGDTNKSMLYMLICPAQYLTNNPNNNPFYLPNIVSATNGILPRDTREQCQVFDSGDNFLCGSTEWTNASLKTNISISPTNSKVTFAIVFIWANNNQDTTLAQTGICIDNIQIASGTIKKPQNLTVTPICEDSTMLVSWEGGSASEFEVQYRKTGTSTWRRADGLTNGVEGFTQNGINCSYLLQRIVEGTYDIRVRAIADTIVSNFSNKNQVLVYCPENHCVNYLDFDSPDVECTYGFNPESSAHRTETPYSYKGYIDFGPDAKESRHTIHVDPTEVDPRTDSMLHTVPPGALASVRLGNWNTRAEAEAITYTLDVDSINAGILLVKYACVLNKPNPTCGDPTFLMEIFDEQTSPISNLCGVPVFSYTSASEAGWNESSDANLVWKDWTAVGINLQAYHGQKLKVRFTTLDCGGGGHYGYAYFTLDCVNAHLETESCGNDAKIVCYAPDGFNYKWYNESGEVVSEDQELVVDPSRQTYTCRVSFVEDSTCYFEVSTVSAPRYPVPEYTYEPIYDQCTSKLKFHNTSHVMNMYDGTETHTNEPCSDCHWFFRRLSNNTTTESYNWSPLYTCPSEGDSIEVTYTCYIGVDNACDSTRIDTIVVPNIIPDTTMFYVTTCPESPIYFGDQWFNTDTTYVGIFPNFAGCDSTSTLHLKVYPIIEDTYRHDSICSDGSVTINGVKYNEPVENHLIMLKTTHGCDSALYYTLTVNQRIAVEVDSLPYACADDEMFYITYDISAGQYDSVRITFNTTYLRDTTIYDPSVNMVAIPYSASIPPGQYMAKITFYQFCCGQHQEQRAIDVRYRSSIVEQKWNDVLTLLSPSHNGGYQFTAFQWYKNGQPILGQTKSYLYEPLDFDASYTVMLTRPDGTTIETCPIYPEYHEQQSDFPTVLQVGQQVPVRNDKAAYVTIYTVSGQLYTTLSLPAGRSNVTAPLQQGVYIVKIVDSEGNTRAQQIIVE